MNVDAKINDILKKAKSKVRELITNDPSTSDEHVISAYSTANNTSERRNTVFLNDSDEEENAVNLQEINEDNTEFHVDFEIGFSESLDIIE